MIDIVLYCFYLLLGYKIYDDYERVKVMQTCTETASSFAQLSTYFQRSQTMKATGVTPCHHRDTYNGDDVTLYYPDFQIFANSCQNVTIDKEDCTVANDLCLKMSMLYHDENSRLDAFLSCLDHYLKIQLNKQSHFRGSNNYCDISTSDFRVIIEVKNEVGTTKCCSFLQSISYYTSSLSGRRYDHNSCPMYLWN